MAITAGLLTTGTPLDDGGKEKPVEFSVRKRAPNVFISRSNVFFFSSNVLCSCFVGSMAVWLDQKHYADWISRYLNTARLTVHFRPINVVSRNIMPNIHRDDCGYLGVMLVTPHAGINGLLPYVCPNLFGRAPDPIQALQRIHRMASKAKHVSCHRLSSTYQGKAQVSPYFHFRSR